MWSLPNAFVLLSAILGNTSFAVNPDNTHSILRRQNSSEIPPPSEDPFYTAPPDFESALPGTILRARESPGNSYAITNASAVYNILYRTTDTRYRPSWAVTTLIVPDKPLESRATVGNSTRGQSALLSYQIAYNSADVNASPSYILSATPDGIGFGIMDDIAKALGRGWYVNVPDFEGPLAAFCAGPQEGHAVLDSVRAVLSRDELSAPGETRYALWGYSGGSLASDFAAEVQASYAPELNFAGAAFGGMVPNITAVYDNVTASPWAGLLPGMLRQYYLVLFVSLSVMMVVVQSESSCPHEMCLELFDLSTPLRVIYKETWLTLDIMF